MGISLEIKTAYCSAVRCSGDLSSGDLRIMDLIKIGNLIAGRGERPFAPTEEWRSKGERPFAPTTDVASSIES